MTRSHYLAILPNIIPSLKTLKRNALLRSSVVKAMAHPTRLLVMERLTHGGQCVNELTALAGCDVTTLSKHLAVMKKAGLLQCERRGVSIYYQIACPCFLEFFRCIDLITANHEAQIVNCTVLAC